MLQLSLSWLGLGPVAVSPWQLLLLVGASLSLARILTWIYAFYDNYCRLHCFPQPPSRHWFWGHMNMVIPDPAKLTVKTNYLKPTCCQPDTHLYLLCHAESPNEDNNRVSTPSNVI